MVLDLSRRVESPFQFEEFYGRNTEKMPVLLSSGRTPMTPLELMIVRPESDSTAESLRDNYVDTAFAVVGNPTNRDGVCEVILAPYSNHVAKRLIRSISPSAHFDGGALAVSSDESAALKEGESLVLSHEQVMRFRNNHYDNTDGKREEVWEFAAEGKTEVLNDYINDVNERTRGNFNTRMGLWLPSTPGLRLLFVGTVGDYSSNADGNYDLDSDNGRLVGVAAEPHAREKSGQGLDARISSAIAQGKAFELNGRVYAQVNGVIPK